MFFNYNVFVYRCRVALLVREVEKKQSTNFMSWLCTGQGIETIDGSYRVEGRQILYDDVINEKRDKLIKSTKNKFSDIIKVNRDNNSFYHCLSQLLIKNGFDSMDYDYSKVRKIIVHMVNYLYENFKVFREFYEYYYGQMDIEEYKLLMSENNKLDGSFVEIMAASHIFDCRIQLKYVMDDKLNNYKISIPSKDGIKRFIEEVVPIYFDNNILRQELFKKEDVYTLIYDTEHSDTSNKLHYFNYLKTDHTTSLDRIKNIMEMLYEIQEFQLTQQSSNCLLNSNIHCNNKTSMCDIRTETCVQNINIKNPASDVLYKITDKDGNVFIGYAEDLEKYKNIKNNSEIKIEEYKKN